MYWEINDKLLSDRQYPEFLEAQSNLSLTAWDILFRNRLSSFIPGGDGGGITRPLPRNGSAEELRGDPTIGPHLKVWTIDQE